MQSKMLRLQVKMKDSNVFSYANIAEQISWMSGYNEVMILLIISKLLSTNNDENN